MLALRIQELVQAIYVVSSTAVFSKQEAGLLTTHQSYDVLYSDREIDSLSSHSTNTKVLL